ncbi:MAG: hypothetical protein MR384_05520 [Lachnospiraceae bacterium]|nr:hypothetical protein [Lachnospiraceae bacterium]
MSKIYKKIVLFIAAISVATVTPGVVVSQNNTVIEIQAAQKKLTKKQARNKLVKYLKKKKKWKASYHLDYDHTSGNKYVFHYYEVLSDHTATVNWYDVNIRTGKITPWF